MPHEDGDGSSTGTSGVAAVPAGDVVEWAGASGPATKASSHENMQPYLGLVFMIALDGRAPAGS